MLVVEDCAVDQIPGCAHSQVRLVCMCLYALQNLRCEHNMRDCFDMGACRAHQYAAAAEMPAAYEQQQCVHLSCAAC